MVLVHQIKNGEKPDLMEMQLLYSGMQQLQTI